MADAPTLDRPVVSSTTRLVRHAQLVVRSCGHTAGEGAVVVLRGFDAGSRRTAAEVRSRLDRAHINAFDVPAPLLASGAESMSTHVCAYVLVSDGGVEVDRIAARFHTPLVRLAGSGETSSAQRDVAAMHVTWLGEGRDGHTFPSAVGRVPGVAFETLLITPNQPGRGELTVRIGGSLGREMPPGRSIKVRCLPEALVIEAIDIHGAATTWLSDSVEIVQLAGLHRVFRDGLSVADLDNGIQIGHLPNALVLHIA